MTAVNDKKREKTFNIAQVPLGRLILSFTRRLQPKPMISTKQNNMATSPMAQQLNSASTPPESWAGGTHSQQDARIAERVMLLLD